MSEALVIVESGVQVPVAPAPAYLGPRGLPGGNIESIGTFTEASGMSVPDGTTIVHTSGYYADGDGGEAWYIEDAAVNAAYVTANPYTSFRSVAVPYAARGWRLIPTAGWLTPEMVGAPGDFSADAGARINAALVIASVRGTRTKTYGVKTPIRVPSNRTFWGGGSTIKMFADFVTVNVAGAYPATLNCPIALEPGSDRAQIIGPLTVDSNKVGVADGGANRRNCVMMPSSTRFLVQGVTARNATGYIFFANGSGVQPSGKVELCHAENGEIHYEMMQGADIVIDRCTSADGDGDIPCSAYVHPTFNNLGCQRIRVHAFYGKGVVSAGLYIVSGGQAFDDIIIEASHFEATGTGVGANLDIAAGGSLTRFKAINSRFIAAANLGVLGAVITKSNFTNCQIKGRQQAFQVGGASDVSLNHCDIEAVPNAGGATFGVSITSPVTASSVRVNGGQITASYPVASSGVITSRDVRHIAWLFSSDSLNGIRDVSALVNYYIDRVDQNRTIVMSYPGSQNLRIYTDAVMGWPDGTVIEAVNNGDTSGGRVVTVVPEAGVTVNAVGGVMTIKPFGRVRLQKMGANTWTLSGDLG